MKPINGRFTRRTTFSLLVGLLLAVLLLWTQGEWLAAQEGEPQAQDQSGLTESMQRMLESNLPAENLPPLGATPCVAGMAGPYPCNDVDLLAFIPLATFGASYGADIWGWTDPLDGTEYALISLDDGTAFVDISDPVNPIYLGKLPTHTGSSIWRDVEVYANHAFIVADANGSHGMQVFDLTELRDVVSPPVTFSETDHYSGFGSSHTLVINTDTGYAYSAGSGTCNGGLHFVNIQDPTNPTNAGCFSADGYTHETQCVVYHGPDTQHQGKEVCFNSNEDTLTIVNVTNKAAPAQLSRTSYAGSGYTHQGWLTEDHHYFLLDDEFDESNFGHNTRTRIWDVSSLDAPFVLDYYDGPTPAIDHNLYIRGNYVFESNYEAGLRILDLSDVANGNLSEVAYFDIYPSGNSPTYNANWGNYPYFDSGVIVVSGRQQGLFILQPNPPLNMATLAYSPGVVGATLDLGQTVTGTLTVSNTGNLTFTFTISESQPWVSVSPTGGPLAPNESLALDVLFDASAVGSTGDYSTTLAFGGDFHNWVNPAVLTMHVTEPSGSTLYLPTVFHDDNLAAGLTLSLGGLILLPAVVTLSILALRHRRR
ncbi:MAG: choice-of-anchor B family protein [Chloroflexi bacterium]|nr:choice-of-anchor B family protein [Chloroflexota bacterium]